MSQLQRIILRMGNEIDVPALKEAELGWDIDTRTMRVGNETDNPWKVLTTGSTGVFDFSNAEVIFGKTNIQDLNGLDLSSLNGSPGILVRTATSGIFTSTEIVSTDGSVNIQNGNGLNGPIDISIDQASIENAIKPIIEDLEQLRNDVDDLTNVTNSLDERVDSLIALSGVPGLSLNLGTFTGSIIPDNVSIKSAFQVLENVLGEFSVDALAIESNTAEQLEIKLVSGSILGLPLAEPNTKAGIINGADKKLIDDLRAINNSGGFAGVTAWTPQANGAQIERSTGAPLSVPLVTETLAGLMSPSDKAALESVDTNLADLTTRISNAEDDIEALDTRVTTAQNTAASAQSTANNAQTIASNAASTASSAQGTANNALSAANQANDKVDDLTPIVNGHTGQIADHETRIDTLESSIGGASSFYIRSASITTLIDHEFDKVNTSKTGVFNIADIVWPFFGLVACRLSTYGLSSDAKPAGANASARIVFNQPGGSALTRYLGGRYVYSDLPGSGTLTNHETNRAAYYMFTVFKHSPTDWRVYSPSVEISANSFAWNQTLLSGPFNNLGSLRITDTTMSFIGQSAGLLNHRMFVTLIRQRVSSPDEII